MDRVKAWLALLLAGTGGFVDAVCYLVLSHTFVAHLSGDTIATGIHAGQRDWPAVLLRAFPIPLFVTGALAGTAAAEVLARRRFRSIFAAPLGLEAVLLFLFVLLGSPFIREGSLEPGSAWRFYGLTALPAFAMGLQSALLWRVVGKRVRTTFITGVLVSLTEEVVKYFFWHRDRSRPPRHTFVRRVSPPPPSVWRILFLLGLWAAYVLGALGGTLAELRWSLLSLAAPIGGALVALIVDLVHPVMPPR
jgi:uncharacterized membrane protein YoaK (UPF0700 family)